MEYLPPQLQGTTEGYMAPKKLHAFNAKSKERLIAINSRFMLVTSDIQPGYIYLKNLSLGESSPKGFCLHSAHIIGCAFSGSDSNEFASLTEDQVVFVSRINDQGSIDKFELYDLKATKYGGFLALTKIKWNSAINEKIMCYSELQIVVVKRIPDSSVIYKDVAPFGGILDAFFLPSAPSALLVQLKFATSSLGIVNMDSPSSPPIDSKITVYPPFVVLYNEKKPAISILDTKEYKNVKIILTATGIERNISAALIQELAPKTPGLTTGPYITCFDPKKSYLYLFFPKTSGLLIRYANKKNLKTEFTDTFPIRTNFTGIVGASIAPGTHRIVLYDENEVYAFQCLKHSVPPGEKPAPSETIRLNFLEPPIKAKEEKKTPKEKGPKDKKPKDKGQTDKSQEKSPKEKHKDKGGKKNKDKPRDKPKDKPHEGKYMPPMNMSPKPKDIQQIPSKPFEMPINEPPREQAPHLIIPSLPPNLPPPLPEKRDHTELIKEMVKKEIAEGMKTVMMPVLDVYMKQMTENFHLLVSKEVRMLKEVVEAETGKMQNTGLIFQMFMEKMLEISSKFTGSLEKQMKDLALSTSPRPPSYGLPPPEPLQYPPHAPRAPAPQAPSYQTMPSGFPSYSHQPAPQRSPMEYGYPAMSGAPPGFMTRSPYKPEGK